jgi:hypothetical protein
MCPRWTSVVPGIANHGLRSGVCHTAKATVPPVSQDPPGLAQRRGGSAMSMYQWARDLGSAPGGPPAHADRRASKHQSR